MERFFEVLSQGGLFHAVESLGAENDPVELLEFQSPAQSVILATCPEEEPLGCGGTMRKHIDQGSKVKVV